MAYFTANPSFCSGLARNRKPESGIFQSVVTPICPQVQHKNCHARNTLKTGQSSTPPVQQIEQVEQFHADSFDTNFTNFHE
jgi:hypothetical protein